MWTTFEQYGFLRNIFDFSTDKSKEVVFWTVIANILIMATGMFKYWTEQVLGLSAEVTIMIFIIMFFDLVTGLSAARIEQEKFCSKKGLRWIFKFGSYTVFIYVLNALLKEVRIYDFGWIATGVNIIKLFVIFTISFWEMKSIDENFERLGFSFGIFKLLNPIYNILKGIIKKQSDVDIGLKEEDEPKL